MSNLLKHTLLFCISLFSISSIAQEVSPRVSIQGTLKDANGASVADGEYEVKFNLYGNFVGGVSKWNETATVEAAGGIYSHYLGSVTDLEAAVFDSTLFLGVTIGGFELSPRTELTYAPYTFAANTALRAQEVLCSGAVGDVKFSVLNPTQFATVNGDCWVPMDGRNVVNTRYANEFNQFAVPDASGLFLRAQEFAGGADNDPDRTPTSDIAQVQNDQLQEHQHFYNRSTSTNGNHSHGATYGNGDDGHGNFVDSGATDGTLYTNSAGNHSHTVKGWTQGAGMGDSNGVYDSSVRIGTETRSKNMNLYVYIRVN